MNTTDRDLLLVSIFTFATVSLWIFFELVKTTKMTTVTSTVAQTIVPIPTSIDTKTLEELSKRKIY